jgi:four helix bundle protein
MVGEVLHGVVHPPNSSLVQDFKKLRVWHDAQSLALRVYEVTEHLPRREHFGLSAQMRRSVISVGSNIAEGCGRNGPGEMSRFLQISITSACELISQSDIAGRLGLMSPIEGRTSPTSRTTSEEC